MKKKRIVITPGEPSGIGPDIVLKLIQKSWPIELVIYADCNLLIERAKQLGLPLKLHFYNSSLPDNPKPAGEVTVRHFSVKNTVISGKLDFNNSKYVIDTLNQACKDCVNGDFFALLTGPVHKGIINRAGFFFRGQTEFFAEKSNCKEVVMMLMKDSFRVALVTTHLPLKEVPNSINSEKLCQKICILSQSLEKLFLIKKPKIYVCGLNPHIGEDGYLGLEEKNIIEPSLKKLVKEGYNLVGPISADTIFQKNHIKKADAILTMYHDQGLPVLKYYGFGRSINITLGLPFIRISVDHGTALNIAGTGKAKDSSLRTALIFIISLMKNYYE